MTTEAIHDLSPVKRALLEVRDLRTRLRAAEQRDKEPIAIVGVGLRLPGGAHDLDSFWRLLRDGVDAIGEVPPERWDLRTLYDPDSRVPGKLTTRWGGFLPNIDRFDAHFFGIAPREAETLDPQHRLLLEVTWEALEQAGHAPDRLFGQRVGIFIGICNSDYFRTLLADTAAIDAYTTSGNALSIAAGRLAYVLGTHGPALAVDTACSSSLVALHLAVQSLRAGESDLALAGGVGLLLDPAISITFSKAQMMAADGRCKTFDAAADGYVRSEGCAILVLRRLSDALTDGDDVLAVVRGSAVNQDGRSSGLTAPNGPAQEAVIRAALAAAGLAPETIGYVEAHGTGTALGDPIETGAIVAALGRDRPPGRPLAIGSVKTNIGHTEAVAGVAGVIKAALMLRHGEIPPHLHLRRLNPLIDFGDAPITIPTTRTSWPATELPRRAGVSSFGLSGTNAHVILEQAPPAPSRLASARPLRLLTLSAKTPTALTMLAERYTEALATVADERLDDICFTAATGRAHFAHRLAVTGGSVGELRGRLLAHLASEEAEGVVRSDGARTDPSPIAWLFTGLGAQYTGMGRALYEGEPVFRAAIDRCAELLRDELDQPLTTILFEEDMHGSGSALVDRIEYAHPAVFALQWALAELWRSWGIEPAVVMGHSIGEYSAACVAGLFSLEDAVRLVAARGRLLGSVAETGVMVAVFADPQRVAEALAPYADSVAIAAINGPSSVVISGRATAVQAVIEGLGEAVEHRRLAIGQASHSPLVEPILDAFERVAATVTYHPLRIPLVSSMSAEMVDAVQAGQAAYWRQHLRRPVRFAEAMETVYRTGIQTFLEIGPHPTLIGLVRRAQPQPFGTWLPSLRRGVGDYEQLAESLGALYAAGAEIDWAALYRDRGYRRVSLPTYPWERQRYWADAAWQRLRGVTGSTPIWETLVAAALRQAEQGPFDLALATYPEKWALLDRLAAAYTVRALRRLELFIQPGECWTVGDLLERRSIAPAYAPLLKRWLGGLAADGLLRREGDRFTALQPLAEPAIAPLEREAVVLLADVPPLREYILRCGELLDAVLTGAESALETLFPGGAYTTVEYLYHRWPVARYFNAIVATIAETVVRLAPAGQTVRMLEIGAGSGGTTAAVLPALPPERVRYHFTDVSDFFLARAEETFAAYPYLTFGRLDIERDPGEQGYTPGSYDVIIAANVLHATRDLDMTLRHVRSLLAPGGILVLYEATTHPRWLDVTTALIAGWQRFDDAWRGDNPLLPADRWQAALQANGFEEACAFPATGSAPEILGQHIILACVPAGVALSLCDYHGDRSWEERESGRAVRRPELGAEAAGKTISAGAAALRRELEAALPDERRELLVEFVRGHLVRVLHLDGAHSLGRGDRLVDLGLDSLMAVELRDRLSSGLGLEQRLPVSLGYDYPTVDAIAGYLENLLTAPPNGQATNAVDMTVPPSGLPAAAEVALLSDAEVEALLLQKLEGL